MSRYLLAFLSLCLASIGLFAQVNVPDFVAAYGGEDFYYLGRQNHLYEVDANNKICRDITKQLYLDKYGYVKANYIPGQTSYLTVKPGDSFLIFAPKQLFYFSDAERVAEFRGQTSLVGLEPTFIKKISSKTYITESSNGKLIAYSPKGLLERFFSTDREFPYDLWPNALPWAIKAENMDSEVLQIEFEQPVSGLLLLNGFVDFYRENLYYDNARIAQITVSSGSPEFEKTYDLIDRIEFQEIDFPAKATSVDIRIKTVYAGKKYADICLSGILPVFNDQMSKKARMISAPDYSPFCDEVFKNYRGID